MNENTKHTPGPWEVVPSSAKGTGTRRRDVVSTGTAFSPSFIAGEALLEDARLIASAPELLAALKAIDTWAAMVHGYTPETADMFRKARAAIAKATAE